MRSLDEKKLAQERLGTNSILKYKKKMTGGSIFLHVL